MYALWRRRMGSMEARLHERMEKPAEGEHNALSRLSGSRAVYKGVGAESAHGMTAPILARVLGWKVSFAEA